MSSSSSATLAGPEKQAPAAPAAEKGKTGKGPAKGRKKKLTKRRRPKKKFKFWQYGLGGFVLLVLLLIWWGTQPLKGTMHVGVCRTFAELSLLYPPTMEVTAAYQFERSQRLFITYMDGFGHHNSTMVDCRFRVPLSGTDYRLEKVTFDRIPVPDAKIEQFNRTIPAIMAGEPNLTIPYPPSEDLKKLRTGP